MIGIKMMCNRKKTILSQVREGIVVLIYVLFLLVRLSFCFAAPNHYCEVKTFAKNVPTVFIKKAECFYSWQKLLTHSMTL